MDPRDVKLDASAALAAANYNPKKLVLLHAGAVALFSLVSTLLSYLLELGMGSAGGLSGIALRSMLESGQVVLSLAGTLLLPFWQIGLISAALGYSRRETVTKSTLLDGFRRFAPVFRLTILLILVAVGVSMASMYIATTIFMFSPLSAGMYEAMDSLLQSGEITAITNEMLTELIPHMGWLLALQFVVILAVGLPIYYRYRMSEFALMNGAKGALAAMRESTWLSRGRRMAMFKFDLSFWWYYGAHLLIALIAYGDALLTLLGVSLPIDANVLYWILFAVQTVLTLVFTWQYGAYYQVSYARYYDLLRENPLPGNRQIPTPQDRA